MAWFLVRSQEETPPPRSLGIKSGMSTFAERRFVVTAPQTRVWDLLATVVHQTLPLEKVDIVSLDRFRAVLNWRLGPLRLPFDVEGTLADISRPMSYGCLMKLYKGPVSASLKVVITLRSTKESATEVSCFASQEGNPSLASWLFKGLQRAFVLKTFDSIDSRLQRLCS